MFQLSKEEFEVLKSHSATSKGKGGRRYPPYVLTEQGVAMLSSVLTSNRGIEVNILIMRAFIKLREIISTHKQVAVKLKDLEKKLKTHDEQIIKIIQVINQLTSPPPKSKKIIGFATDKD